MCFSSDSSDRTRKAKVRNFIRNLRPFLLEQNIFRFDIAMYEIFLVDALQPLHDLDDNPDGLFQRKSLARQLGLVGEKISLLAVLHNDDDEVRG